MDTADSFTDSRGGVIRSSKQPFEGQPRRKCAVVAQRPARDGCSDVNQLNGFSAPLMMRFVPDTRLATGLARNTTPAATSLAVPIRPVGLSDIAVLNTVHHRDAGDADIVLDRDFLTASFATTLGRICTLQPLPEFRIHFSADRGSALVASGGSGCGRTSERL